MNKIQESKGNHSHSANHGPQDNCDGCQQQRRQNNMLVNFYERLNKIETKVDKIKGDVAIQQKKDINYRTKMQNIKNLLKKKPEQALKSIKQHDSKEMGYELASALIEREIKTKMENQRLQAIIDQLQKQKQKLQSQKYQSSHQEYRQSFNTKSVQKQHAPQSRYSDVLDKVRNTNDSSYFLQRKKDKDMSNSYFMEDSSNKKYWEQSSAGQQQTNFSTFASPVLHKQKSKSDNQNQYQGLNLWLYQFKPEQVDQSSIKSLRNVGKGSKQSNYKSKF